MVEDSSPDEIGGRRSRFHGQSACTVRRRKVDIDGQPVTGIKVNSIVRGIETATWSGKNTRRAPSNSLSSVVDGRPALPPSLAPIIIRFRVLPREAGFSFVTRAGHRTESRASGSSSFLYSQPVLVCRSSSFFFITHLVSPRVLVLRNSPIDPFSIPLPSVRLSPRKCRKVGRGI